MKLTTLVLLASFSTVSFSNTKECSLSLNPPSADSELIQVLESKGYVLNDSSTLVLSRINSDDYFSRLPQLTAQITKTYFEGGFRRDRIVAGKTKFVTSRDEDRLFLKLVKKLPDCDQLMTKLGH